jgi:anti-sigma28 factor (negative regulator of flagellin synthesis)
MKVRNITDPVGSYIQSAELAKNPEATPVANQDSPAVSRQPAEAFTLSADFGSGDPAEAAKRAERVQELKAQFDAGTLKPADSKLVASKLIEDLFA